MNYFSQLHRSVPPRLTTVAVAMLICISILFCTSPARPEQFVAAGLSKTEIIRLGEKMYRNGILPSGKPMGAYIRPGGELDKSAFSCASCHFQAGLGAFEEGIIIPPITGSKLYKPFRRVPSPVGITVKPGRDYVGKTISQRPAYTRESLARAIRHGVNPAGEQLNTVMPRYPLSDSDMSILIQYLELLSSEPSPGATDSFIKFATIISDDVSQEERQALLGQLKLFVDRKNQQKQMYDDFLKFNYAPTPEMQFAFRNASLDVWDLKGPPETWQKQLNDYYSRNPVFAVLGGISNNSWRPVHEFCEAERLPCLFPITDLPVVSETDWYTYYFNKGYFQEGEAVARYLNRLDTLTAGTRLLQVVQDSPAGRALADGFRKFWKDFDRPDVPTVTLSAIQLQDKDTLDKLLLQHKPGLLLLWTDGGLLQGMTGLVGRLSAPGMVFMSSGYLGKKTASAPDAVRNSLYLTFPYRLTPYAGSKTGGFDAPVPTLTTSRSFGDRRIESKTIAMLQQVTLQGLNLMHDNLYRDHLYDVMSVQMDVVPKDYERFSFGAGERYVSKGCYIIQLGPGPEPDIIPRSEWLIQ